MFRLIFRWSGRFSVGILLVASLLSAWQWSTSAVHTIQSVALHETRTYRVFNSHSEAQIVYSLDGATLRNSLVPAVVFSISAILQGRGPPKIVAVYSNANRDRDFRPVMSAPTYWRPRIVGRSSEFDTFLMRELMPQIESRQANETRRYLLGHSLSGLYALDLAARVPGQFAGVFVFAPTFSHDTTIGGRLPAACNANTVLYANWGLESSRDTDVFEATVAQWKADDGCRKNSPLTPRHYGSLHQIVMLTGQIHAAFLLFD
jgi:predicted alpha/beta superfamily hydrolase